MKYDIYFKDFLAAIDATLEKLLPSDAQPPAVIHEAMRYSVFPSGKRFRPILTLAACEAAGGKIEEALIPAASIELIHCYSLVHDDLPSMDNDELRRGKPACHKKFGEAIALLAGDGLLTLAFQILAGVQPAKKAAQLLQEISTSAGTYGMIGGQVAELVTRPEDLNLPMLDYISIHKTGKLIKASAVCGAIAAGASRESTVRMLKFGEFMGLAFQSIDDFSDRDGYMRVVKPRDVRVKVRDLIAMAKREIRPFGKKAEKLQASSDFLLKQLPRKNYVAVDR